MTDNIDASVTELPTPALVTVRLGDIVDYRNRDGREMMAFVIATPDSDDVASMPGCVHLFVISPRSGPYIKHDVPEGDEPNSWHART